ncbi:MAG: hypothetical protein MZV65_39590 [Chromatiales bacterium]|nr:hypothetical protein [Chromatiales bacterium]MCK7581140.1 hypothetical protein [Chromatiales bacterium]
MNNDIAIRADELTLHSVWRQAAMTAVEAFEYGDIIPLEWIREHLEIDEPVGLLTVERHRELQFDLLQKVESFKTIMLEEHKRFLVNVRGVGYKIIEPPHQTNAAMKRFQREFHKSLQQAMSALVHINESVLTLEDARDNAEAKAKLGYLKAIGKHSLDSKQLAN